MYCFKEKRCTFWTLISGLIFQKGGSGLWFLISPENPQHCLLVAAPIKSKFMQDFIPSSRKLCHTIPHNLFHLYYWGIYCAFRVWVFNLKSCIFKAFFLVCNLNHFYFPPLHFFRSKKRKKLYLELFLIPSTH